MLDRYWFGDVRRISPEAPVPVVSVTATSERLGGAGNVARNITALGGVCTLLGVIGDDEAGRSVAAISRDSQVIAALETDRTIKTTIKLRVVCKNQQLLRADFENKPDPSVIEKLLVKYERLIPAHDVVILSDYGKGGLGEIAQWMQIAKSHGRPILIDPKGNDYSRYHGATMITPNLAEFEAAAGVGPADALAGRAQSLIARHGLDSLLITLSDKGMQLFQRHGKPVYMPARSREVYDVSGAGDTVIAVMAMALSAGLSRPAGMALANSAAGVVIAKLGTAAIDREELRAAIKQDYRA